VDCSTGEEKHRKVSYWEDSENAYRKAQLLRPLYVPGGDLLVT
jgi:hypothetical protein